MTPYYFILLFFCSALFGGTIGAYFGTADYRIRNGEPLITSECHCPRCGHTLPLTHQIPVVSWFALRGRCRFCGEPIPARYPLTEAGFLLWYSLGYLLLWRHPAIMLAVWYLTVSLLLLLRGLPHLKALLKAEFIFSAYHLLYGTVMIAVLSGF